MKRASKNWTLLDKGLAKTRCIVLQRNPRPLPGFTGKDTGLFVGAMIPECKQCKVGSGCLVYI